MLRLLLKIDGDQDWDSEHPLEDDARNLPAMRFDPSMENIHINVTRIDFKFGEETGSERVIFFKNI